MSERQKVIFALIASAVLHLAGGLFATVWTRLHPGGPARMPADADPLEVTFVAAPSPPDPAAAAHAAPTPPPAKILRTELDADGLATAETPPENAKFESDRNSRAASEMPATGDAPLPSQEGKERPAAEFTTHDYSLGKGERPAPESALEVAKAAPPAPEPPRPKFAASQPSPEPITEVEPVKKPDEPAPTPTPPPEPTPPPDAVALGSPTPTPSPTPADSPAPTPPEQLAKMVTTPALRAHTEAPREQPAEPGYQPQREKTKIEGGISNRGRAGVDSVATPLGRYKKSIADAVGSRWYHYVNQQMDLITVGEVHIKFRVTASGRVEGVKVVSNSANESFGGFCIRAVSEAKIPPMPPDIAPTLEDGKLEIDYRFNIYPQ